MDPSTRLLIHADRRLQVRQHSHPLWFLPLIQSPWSTTALAATWMPLSSLEAEAPSLAQLPADALCQGRLAALPRPVNEDHRTPPQGFQHPGLNQSGDSLRGAHGDQVQL